MKTLREPILNGFLQSDFDAAGFRILNLPGGISKVVTVDALKGDDSRATIGGDIVFLTLAGALAAINVDQHLDPNNRTGYVLQINPGDYAFDGAQELHIDDLFITGYGAVFSSLTATNEQTKLLVSGRNIIIEGISLDGNVSTGDLPAGFDNTDAAAGAIQVIGTGLILRDCVIHDFAAAAVYGSDQYDGIKIERCTFSGNQNGALFVTTGPTVLGVDFLNNHVELNRRGGLVGTGSGNSTTKAGLANLHIEGNDFAQNGVGGVAQQAIDLSGYIKDAQILRNYIQGSDGLKISKCLRATISGNDIWNSTNPVILEGCQVVEFVGNTMDGRNSQGVSGSAQAIFVTGFYAAAGDSGPYVFSGNTVVGIGSTKRAIYCVGQNDVLITGNRFNATVYIEDSNSVQIKGNTISLDSNQACIILLALAADSAGIEISGNRLLSPTGGPYTSLIKTTATAPFLLTELYVLGNTSLQDRIYNNGIIEAIGVPFTPKYVEGNQPPSTFRLGGTYDNRRGWVNDRMVRNEADQFEIPASSVFGYYFAGVAVVQARKAGWSRATGTATRTTFATTTVTLNELAQRVKALIDDLHSDTGHGLIGP